MKKIMKQFKNERGLTLVELLAVIVILAIVGTIAFVSIGSVIDNSREDAVISNALQVVSAAKLAQATENTDFSSEVDINKLSLDTMYDPWNQGEALTGTVQWKETKVTNADNEEETIGEFYVTLIGSKCEINDQPESELRKGNRNELCDKPAAGE